MPINISSTFPLANNVSSIVFGLVYWYVWTRLIPKWKGYKLEEESSQLDDGTTITKLVHVPI
jgi:hypothetical protein